MSGLRVVCLVIGIICLLAGSIMWGVGTKEKWDQERAIIAGQVIFAAGVLFTLLATVSQMKKLSNSTTVIGILLIVGTIIGLAFALIADERMTKISNISDDYKNYHDRWYYPGMIAAGICGALFIITMIVGSMHGKESPEANGSVSDGSVSEVGGSGSDSYSSN